MENNKIQPQQSKLTQLQIQLIQMGFQLNDIQRVQKVTNEKEKIVEILLGYKDLNNNSESNKQKVSNDNKMQDQNLQQDDQGFESVQQQYKMVFLARMDLKLSLGKIAAQVATGTLSAFKQLQSRADKDQLSQIAYYQWLESGQKKIVVKVNSQQELLKLVEVIEKEKINVFVVRSKKEDQLEKQIPQGTITVAAVGPAPEELVDKLTRHLKLF